MKTNQSQISLFSKRGDTIMMALICALITAVVAAGIQSVIKYTNNQAKHSRVQNIMRAQELALLSVLLNPSSYGENNTLRDPEQIFSSLSFKRILGAQCADTATDGCGVELSNYNYDPDASTFQARLSYTGTDIHVADRQVNFELPDAQLIVNNRSCSPERPLFVGISPEGVAVCREIAPCPAGRLATGFDPRTRSLDCQNMQDTQCPPEQPLLSQQGSENNRNLASIAQVNCQGLFDPFEVWGRLQ